MFKGKPVEFSIQISGVLTTYNRSFLNKNCIVCGPLRWAHTHVMCTRYLPEVTISLSRLSAPATVLIFLLSKGKMNSIQLKFLPLESAVEVLGLEMEL